MNVNQASCRCLKDFKQSQGMKQASPKGCLVLISVLIWKLKRCHIGCCHSSESFCNVDELATVCSPKTCSNLCTGRDTSASLLVLIIQQVEQKRTHQLECQVVKLVNFCPFMCVPVHHTSSVLKLFQLNHYLEVLLNKTGQMKKGSWQRVANSLMERKTLSTRALTYWQIHCLFIVAEEDCNVICQKYGPFGGG